MYVPQSKESSAARANFSLGVSGLCSFCSDVRLFGMIPKMRLFCDPGGSSPVSGERLQESSVTAGTPGSSAAAPPASTSRRRLTPHTTAHSVDLFIRNRDVG